MTRHGPALKADLSGKSVDAVRCVRCLSWPSQAADWPTRLRNHDWPDSATVDRVVNNGCDVVGVAHRHCKQHELLNKIQWRLSLSRAEIALINSWMPVQQITYHILRVFAKKAMSLNEEGRISNYHIKTLMLWACELTSRNWWTNDVNVVRICVELLQILAVWASNVTCPHYFIKHCNLMDSSSQMDMVASQLWSVDRA